MILEVNRTVTEVARYEVTPEEAVALDAGDLEVYDVQAVQEGWELSGTEVVAEEINTVTLVDL